MQLLCQCTQPIDHRRFLSHRQRGELARDTNLAHRFGHVLAARFSTNFANQQRHHYRESRINNSLGKCEHAWSNARYFVNNYNTRAYTFAIRGVRNTSRRKRTAMPARWRERNIFLHTYFGLTTPTTRDHDTAEILTTSPVRGACTY